MLDQDSQKVVSSEPPSRSILLAEDDAELRSLLASLLRDSGYEVVEACSGAELAALIGYSMLDSGKLVGFDVIVSDVEMPGWSGLGIAQSLRAAGCGVPVILMSGFADAGVRDAARRFGAAILDKPFELDELCAEVERLLSARPG
jgi:CheY-like chemotaxis protein